MPPPSQPSSPSVLTLGSFDGVHRGHQALLTRAKALAAPHHARVVALVFDPSPVATLNPASAPPVLTPWATRERLLREAGADEVVRLEPTRELLNLTPAQFVAHKVASYHPVAWVEGPDFRFGHRRAGDINTLATLGKQHGFEVAIVDNIEVPLTDHIFAPARSTTARWLISQGRVRDAACVLGRPHLLEGTVVQGDRLGRKLGFPTANLDTPSLLPADGVYAAIAELPTGERQPAALSIGTKPMFQGKPRTAEAFILTAHPDHPTRWSPLPGLPEYAWPLRLHVLAWVREQVPFDTLEALVQQIERDCDRIADIVAHETPSQGQGAEGGLRGHATLQAIPVSG